MISAVRAIDEIVSGTRRTFAVPAEFFVAWQGVLTLAYTGFTPPLAEIKEEIGQIDGIAAENPGAKWPKTTLGAVRDGKRLSPDDLLTLRDVCDQYNDKLKLESWALKVDSIQVVLFACRSLEKRLTVHEFGLAEPEDPSPPSKEEVRQVEKVLSAFARKNLHTYWVNVAADRYRCAHYREPHIEATLVCDLNDTPSCVPEFRAAVDAVLPDMYCWFEDESLHMTIRGLS